ncbi:MAG TPA: glycoside hydrolase family 18 protein, partial [Polyangiaceae bacterium]|nr:glycoside hydrolase family 18 protein [Polyangiaceae bacterium]
MAAKQACSWLRLVPLLALLVLVGCLTAPVKSGGQAQAAAPEAVPAPPPGSVVLGYSASWVDGVYPPKAYDYQALTHIARSFLIPRPDGSIGDSGGFWDPDLERLAKQHDVKLLAAIGGAAENADHWLGMARNQEARTRFFYELEKLITQHHYDGVDIDWEPSALNDADQATFTEFMVALRARFPKWIITTALGPSDWWARHVSWPEVSASVDFINLMTYTFAGAWSGYSGHNANLYPPSSFKENGGIAVAPGIEHLITKYRVPPEKIALGLAFYGTQFSTDKMGDTFAKDAVYKGNEMTLTDIAALRESSDYRKLWDDGAQAPYLERVAGGHTISYDDERSTVAKCEVAKKRGLAGVMIWHVGGDVIRGRTPLLDTVAKAFGRPSTAPELGYLQHFYGVRARQTKKLADDFERQLAELAKLDAARAAKYGGLPKPADVLEQAPASGAEIELKLSELDRHLTRLQPALFSIGRELESMPVSTKTGRALPLTGPTLRVGDFENGQLQHALGGPWESSFDPNGLGTTQSPSPLALSPGGRSGSKSFLRIFGHFGKSQAPWPYADVRASFESSDLTPFSAIRFWAKGDGKSYVVAIVRSA